MSFNGPLNKRTTHKKGQGDIEHLLQPKYFIATIIGAALLAQGDDGFAQKVNHSIEIFHYFIENINKLKELPNRLSIYRINECVIEVPYSSQKIISRLHSKVFTLEC